MGSSERKINMSKSSPQYQRVLLERQSLGLLKDSENTVYYKEGKSAALAGESVDDNPYGTLRDTYKDVIKTTQQILWRRGWMDVYKAKCILKDSPQ